MRRRKILITGSSGGLGSALVRSLHNDHDLVQLDLREPGNADQQRMGLVITGSITDPEVVARAMDSVDTVIHGAAVAFDRKPYHEVVETNVMGTFRMLEEAGSRREVEQFIYVSSIRWHGLHDQFTKKCKPKYLPIDESHPCLAIMYYSGSKVQAEWWCEAYAARFGKPVVAIRPSLIVTLEQESTYAAKEATEWPDLSDYVGTSDLVDGIARAMDYYPTGGFDRFLFHAADQRTTTPSVALAERFFPGVPLNRESLDACDGFGALVDCSHARKKLGWTPKFRCKR